MEVITDWHTAVRNIQEWSCALCPATCSENTMSDYNTVSWPRCRQQHSPLVLCIFSSVWFYCVSTFMCPLLEHTCEMTPFMQVSFRFPFIISTKLLMITEISCLGLVGRLSDQHSRRWELHTGWGCPDNKTWKGTTFWPWKLYDLGPNQSWWQVLLEACASLFVAGLSYRCYSSWHTRITCIWKTLAGIFLHCMRLRLSICLLRAGTDL